MTRLLPLPDWHGKLTPNLLFQHLIFILISFITMGKNSEESGDKAPPRWVREELTKKGSGFRSWNGRRAFKKPIVQQP
jgi:hypothetical protein